MKKILLLILFFPLISFSQNMYIPDKFEDDYFPYFSEGSYQYLIADNVNIDFNKNIYNQKLKIVFKAKKLGYFFLISNLF
mgnify:CR=1 FL=1